MPLFGNKHSFKKTPPRKSPSVSSLHRDLDPVTNKAEFGFNYGTAKLELGEQETVFQNGNWVSSSDLQKTASRKILKENQRLQEENNFLKLKIEVLVNMLAETTAELHLQENELEELKAQLRSQSTRSAGQKQ